MWRISRLWSLRTQQHALSAAIFIFNADRQLYTCASGMVLLPRIVEIPTMPRGR
jgi:hypothetical protein